MEVNEKNLQLLNDENKKKFGYLCVKHVFPRVKSAVLQEFKDSEEKRPIEAVELVERWLNDPSSVSVEELDAASAAARGASVAARGASVAASVVARGAWGTASVAAWGVSVAASEKEQKWQESLLDKVLLQQFKDMDDNEIIISIRNQELNSKQQMVLNSILELAGKEHLANYLTSHFSGWQLENLKKTIKEEIVRMLK